MIHAEISQRFKIRCSAISQIMAGTVGLSDTQETALQKHIFRRDDPDAKPLTDKMEAEMIDLQNKKDNPTLPQGAKSYCLGWLKEQPEFYDRRIEFTSKYTDKGLIVEDDALEFVAERLGYGFLVKNDQRFECEYITGEPDNIQPNHTLDIKAPWTFATFPIFETEPKDIYWWQGQGYMHLTHRPKHRVIYVLMNTPAGIINREVRSQAYRAGLDEDQEMELYEDLFKAMTYDDIPDQNRIKVFEFDRDTEAIEDVKRRVKMCQQFIFETLNKFVK